MIMLMIATISDNKNNNNYAQAEKRRQSGLPWILVTTLMMAAQLVGASLAATDFAQVGQLSDHEAASSISMAKWQDLICQ